MRISDDRYSPERLCLDLALRFLRHEARPQTIQTRMGLTDDRIRNLYRSYMSRVQFVPRHLLPRRMMAKRLQIELLVNRVNQIRPARLPDLGLDRPPITEAVAKLEHVQLLRERDAIADIQAG
jgi:hypothetical protein